MSFVPCGISGLKVLRYILWSPLILLQIILNYLIFLIFLEFLKILIVLWLVF